MTYPIYHIYWYDLPFRTLACRTLVVLDLRGFVLHSRDVWLVELPLLKVLRLNWVKFAAEECLPQLLSGCPILEDFAAMNLKIDNDNISSDKLLRARIEHMRRLNLRRIRLNLPLQLQVFYNVGDLDLLIERVPPDYNSRMKLTFYQVYRWQWLIGMLNHCPQLQIFELDIKERYRLRGEHHDDNYDDDWLYTEFVPGCISLSLRECTIHCYEGAEGAPQFARYIMQNASVLHTMRIRVRGSEVLRFEIEKELSLCQKRSAACQLVFS